MKKSDAIEKGYSFTGSYGRKEEMKTRQKEDKDYKGYKTVLVPEKSDGYSRSAGDYRGRITGYSIYAERKYFIDNSIRDLESRISGFEEQTKNLIEKQKKEMEQLFESHIQTRESLGRSKAELHLLNSPKQTATL